MSGSDPKCVAPSRQSVGQRGGRNGKTAQLDDVDRTIVDQLSRDSDQSVVALCRWVCLSQATHDRLRRLAQLSLSIAPYTTGNQWQEQASAVTRLVGSLASNFDRAARDGDARGAISDPGRWNLVRQVPPDSAIPRATSSRFSRLSMGRPTAPEALLGVHAQETGRHAGTWRSQFRSVNSLST